MPVPVVSQEYNFYELCPIPEEKKARDQYKLDQNETPSYSDNLFDDLREKEKAELKKDKKWEFTDQDWARVADEARNIEVSKELIETHVDRRVASFFEQLIVCYKVPYHYEIGDTMHQAESTKTLTKKVGNTTQKVPFDSAHSSTIPCLYAYSRNSWANWKNGELEEKPAGFVYLQDSDTYRLHNSTMGLVKVINQADIAIDGTKNNNKLRGFAIDKINDVAKGILTPMKGVEEFVDKAILITENQLASNSCKEKTKKVLRIYLDSFKAIKPQIKNPSFFDYLLNVKSPQGNQAIRQAIYIMRFKIIRECHEVQTAIFQKIKKVSAEIVGIERKPANFDKALKRVLLERTNSDPNRKSLQKLFNLSLEDLKKQVPNKNIAAFKKIETKENLQKIDRLVNSDIVWDFHGLRNKELFFRRDLFYKLRSTYKWPQWRVAHKYKKLFPRKPMSQSGVSRIENTIKWIDHPLALDMAKVYRLDPGVFLPFLFTSLYT